MLCNLSHNLFTGGIVSLAGCVIMLCSPTRKSLWRAIFVGDSTYSCLCGDGNATGVANGYQHKQEFGRLAFVLVSVLDNARLHYVLQSLLPPLGNG